MKNMPLMALIWAIRYRKCREKEWKRKIRG